MSEIINDIAFFWYGFLTGVFLTITFPLIIKEWKRLNKKRRKPSGVRK
ncbi:hypothetical protein LCGC14_0632510 [marine sediment metagenome]|uniref:Uncharacterized protein n=1 Tax=marine sediment metagenome TaxID=412755 RepID=A0A0F9TMW6_9ZZZZ